MLLTRGQPSDLPQAREHLLWAHQQATLHGYAEASQIATILEQQGWLLPAGEAG